VNGYNLSNKINHLKLRRGIELNMDNGIDDDDDGLYNILAF
jgi:hypothetical protein